MSVNVTAKTDWVGHWPSGKGAVLVIDGDLCYLAREVGALDAMSCWDLTADDPGIWEDFSLLWYRYQFIGGGAEEFADLPFRIYSRSVAFEMLREHSDWFCIDLDQRRITFAGVSPLERFGGHSAAKIEATFSTRDLPRWWEVAHGSQVEDLDQPRDTPLVLPDSCREVLWGKPLMHYFSQRMADAVAASPDTWHESIDAQTYGDTSLTIEIHRDWLLTPRRDLCGCSPREKLHLGIEWIERLALDQEANRYGGGTAVSVSPMLSSYATAPMGRAEVIFYFHACRAILEAGWQWLLTHHPRGIPASAVEHLRVYLESALKEYLKTPCEDSLTPAEIIAFDRGRIPITVGNSHFTSHDGEHAHEAECPICEMLGMNGMTEWTLYFDGYACEMDDEFAFSLWPTREEWERARTDWSDTGNEESTERGSTDPGDLKGPNEKAQAYHSSFIGRCCEASTEVGKDILSDSESSD